MSAPALLPGDAHLLHGADEAEFESVAQLDRRGANAGFNSLGAHKGPFGSAHTDQEEGTVGRRGRRRD